MFTLSHVKKSFGDNPVLRDVSIKVNDGDVVAVLGPSGSGKTTLLRAASYLTRADGGTVELDGEIFPLNKISRRDLLRYRRKTPATRCDSPTYSQSRFRTSALCLHR